MKVFALDYDYEFSPPLFRKKELRAIFVEQERNIVLLHRIHNSWHPDDYNKISKYSQRLIVCREFNWEMCFRRHKVEFMIRLVDHPEQHYRRQLIKIADRQHQLGDLFIKKIILGL